MEDLCKEFSSEHVTEHYYLPDGTLDAERMAEEFPEGAEERYTYDRTGWHGWMTVFLGERISEAHHYEEHHRAPDGRWIDDWPAWCTIVWRYFWDGKSIGDFARHEQHRADLERSRTGY